MKITKQRDCSVLIDQRSGEIDSYEIDVLGKRNENFRIANTQVSSVFDHILQELLTEDIERFQRVLEKALEPQKDYLTETEHQLYRRGKKLRPMMLMLSARMIHGERELPEKVILAAVSLEMLHVATLIHDDIIDGALMRRGLKSVNATRGSNAAILVGNLQFLQGIRSFLDAIDTDSEMGLVKQVLDTAFRICCGEIDELNTDPYWELKKLKEHYYQVIERKTAIMFGLACETGVALAQGHSSDARRAGYYGRRVGRAFQIMDDLFDNLLPTNIAGKIQGTDLAQKRFSLPIIYAMEELGDDHLVSQIARGVISPTSKQLIEGVEAIKLSDGFSRAYADARYQALDALEFLAPFPDNQYRQALSEIALSTVDRSF
ncbi:polyprenyl synthetase family protein [Moorena producens]|uniref:polyprenyl synthetase family protein n=1 Tax=Moorena producens TaxID=1155739 RepID=UPI003C7710B6